MEKTKPTSLAADGSAVDGTVGLPRRAARAVVYRGRALRDFARDGKRARGWLKHRVWRRLRPLDTDQPGQKLHVGCGKERLEGWCNIDLLPLPHVDLCLDVTRGLPFRRASLIFAEHFLEHLEVIDALDFLDACFQSLEDGGWLRLSTPNLDWVWTHLYSRKPEADRADLGIQINRAFYGWQHRFLWNRELLQLALEAAGFHHLRECAYGESEIDDFRGIEKHELYDDTPELPHVLIAEAQKGPAQPEKRAELRRRLDHEFVRCRI